MSAGSTEQSSGKLTRPTAAIGPALIAASVALVGVVVGAMLNLRQLDSARTQADRQRAIEVARIKRDIVEAVNNYDLPTAQLLLTHVLKPIDDQQTFERFSSEFLGLVAARAPGTDPRARSLEADTQTSSASVESDDPSDLVRLFEGPERLLASNRLVTLHRNKPEETIRALVGGILPESDRRSYRVNLYVAYTLGRLRPNWTGTEGQVEAIRALAKSASYGDPTFKARVDEALRNLRPRA